MKTTLQVPIKISLKNASEKLAEEYGYSSLQELVRIFLSQLISRKITPQFVSSDEFLTSEEEAILTQKYLQAKEDIKSTKGFVAKTPNQMIRHLAKT